MTETSDEMALRARARELAAGATAEDPTGWFEALYAVVPWADPAAMPWPLTRAELAAMAADVLREVRVEIFQDGRVPRWNAEFTRPVR